MNYLDKITQAIYFIGMTFSACLLWKLCALMSALRAM